MKNETKKFASDQFGLLLIVYEGRLKICERRLVELLSEDLHLHSPEVIAAKVKFEDYKAFVYTLRNIKKRIEGDC